MILYLIDKANTSADTILHHITSPNWSYLYDQEKQKGNRNRATLAVARKMVAYLVAVDRQQRDFVPAEEVL